MLFDVFARGGFLVVLFAQERLPFTVSRARRHARVGDTHRTENDEFCVALQVVRKLSRISTPLGRQIETFKNLAE
jgi:hypothetical protein